MSMAGIFFDVPGKVRLLLMGSEGRLGLWIAPPWPKVHLCGDLPMVEHIWQYLTTRYKTAFEDHDNNQTEGTQYGLLNHFLPSIIHLDFLLFTQYRPLVGHPISAIQN